MYEGPEVESKLLFTAILYPKSLVTKKNNRPIFRGKNGRSFIGKSAALASHERDLLLQLRSVSNALGIFKPISTRIFVRILFYMERITNLDGSFNKRQQDLDNLLAGPLDALQAAGIIENDNLIMGLSAEKIESNTTKIGIFILNHETSGLKI